MAVGPIGAGVGATNDGVRSGVAATVAGRLRSTAVGLGVRATMGVGAAAHALRVAHSAAAALSGRNLSQQSVLTGTL